MEEQKATRFSTWLNMRNSTTQWSKRPWLVLAYLIAMPTTAADASIELTPMQRINAGIETVELELDNAVPARGLTLTGRVETGAGYEAAIVAPAAARVAEVLAPPGSRVRRNERILVLQGPELTALQRSLAEARAAVALAGQRRDRERQLLREGIIAASRMEQTEADWATAAAQLAQIEGMLAQFSSEAAGRLAARAPTDGRVEGPRHPVGGWVEAGQLLARIGAPHMLRIALSASIDAARQLAPGDAVTVRSRGCEAAAVVQAIGTLVDEAQVVPVEAELRERESCLLAGEAVTAVVAPRAAVSDGWPAPATAFVRRGADTFVFIERGAFFVPIKVDSEAARSGFARAPQLQRGTRIVVSGTALLKGAWLATEGN